MQPKNVDVIHFESPKAGFDGLDHRLATVTSRVRMLIQSGAKSVLGSENNRLSFRSDQFTHDRFARSIRVNRCGINEVASGVAKYFVDLSSFVPAGSPTPIGSEG